MGLPITYLQSILHNDENELDKYRFFSEQLRTGEYLVELKTGELVTINQLTRFYETYSKGYKFVPEEKAKSITKDLDELITKYKENEKVECEPKEKAKLQSKQEVERLQASDECETKGIGPDNTKEVVQGSKPTSQEPKRRRIRKSDK